jgi:SulP family sulfate permease
MIRLVRRFHLTENPKTDILSGITVALALVPEAIAFAFVAGVAPLVGLYAAFIVGLITSIFGGRSGMISGATGALAVVMVSLVATHGVQYLFATVVLMGILQILAGISSLGKYIRLVPHPVMLGFVNGLAIVIFLAQLGQFKIDGNWMPSADMALMIGLTILTMAVIWLFPKLTKIIPAPLMAILITSALVIGLNLDTRTVGDLASIAGSLPSFHIPTVPINMETLLIIFPYAAILASIGLIESLLTLRLIDEMTETRGRTKQECIGQGLANLTTGFFGGMGGCAMIGQSMINVNSGGRGRLSGIAAALALLAFILFASNLIELIPLAALTGVMMMVVIGTFAWGSVRLWGNIPKEDFFVIVAVTAITVATDLAIAVFSGVIISALVYAWKSAQHLWVVNGKDENGTRVYSLQGPLFFGSITSFKDLFDPRTDPDHIIIDFKNSHVWDHSALNAIDELADKYTALNKKLQLVHLSPDCALLLKNASHMVTYDTIEDPHYAIFTDYTEEVEKP